MKVHPRVLNFYIFVRKHSRASVLLLDVLLCTISVIIALQISKHLSFFNPLLDEYMFGIVLLLSIRLASFIYQRIYAVLVRFITAFDTLNITITLLLGSILFFLLNLVASRYGKRMLPDEVIFIEFVFTSFFISTSRITLKKILTFQMIPFDARHSIAIYGCDQSAVLVKRALEKEAKDKHKVLCFISTKRNSGNILDGVRIYSEKKLDEVFKKFQIQQLIISSQNLTCEHKKTLFEKCRKLNVEAITVPEVNNWINGNLGNTLKDIKIEDLLEREPILLDKEQLFKQIYGKRVLVTGAAGSIGSEIVRQLTRLVPQKLILIDQAETPMYELDLVLKEELQFNNYELIMADVRNAEIIEQIFKTYTPHIVFHAAAYKHVPMMEKHPAEAIRTNVFGTINLANAASKYKTKKFVFISTDKAVNPTNIMGTSKRIAEIYVQSLNNISETKFITTRFGNVLGSNGSVIPRFRKQIEAGGPVTVTHPDITRFFMTIPEACHLVLVAGAMGIGGEIFLFDMGEPVKIADLARKMIKLSSANTDKQIDIEFTGLREGEKLTEELLSSLENTLTTFHPKIMIAKVRQFEFNSVKLMITDLQNLLENGSNTEIVSQMKYIVPEFISNNSDWSKLDTPKFDYKHN